MLRDNSSEDWIIMSPTLRSDENGNGGDEESVLLFSPEEEIERVPTPDFLSGIVPKELSELLTIVSIAYNEEQLIPRYFTSISKCFGKIGVTINVVIVDTGSTDTTRDLAREAGARVVEAGTQFAHFLDRDQVRKIHRGLDINFLKVGQRVFDFGSARQFADRQAETPWILSLDICDVIEQVDMIDFAKTLTSAMTKLRVLDPILEAARLQMEKGFMEKYNGNTEKVRIAMEEGWIARRNQIYGRCVSNYEFVLLYGKVGDSNAARQTTARLYYGKWSMWHCFVHEYVESGGGLREQLDEKLLKVRHAQRDVVHNYLPSLAYAYFIQPPKSTFDQNRMRYYLGRELCYRGYGKAAKPFLEAVIKAKQNWIKECSSAALFLAQTMEKPEDKLVQIRRAIAIYPGWRDPYLEMARQLMVLDDFATATGVLESTLLVTRPTDILFSEGGQNYGVEPHRLMIASLIGWIKQMILAQDPNIPLEKRTNPNPVPLFERLLEIPVVDNMTQVQIFKIGYRVLRYIDPLRAKEYFDKAQAIDSTLTQDDINLL
jgi:glycosyltransferase involved in cell wall biosynthesis